MTIQRISAPDAYKLKAVGYVMLDIRAPEEYAKGHPVGAVNVPYKFYNSKGGFAPNPQFMPVVEALYDKTTKLLVIGKIGKRSLAAAEELVAAGYEEVCDLRPGVMGIVNAQNDYVEDGWITNGLPMETQTDGGSYAELNNKAGL